VHNCYIPGSQTEDAQLLLLKAGPAKLSWQAQNKLKGDAFEVIVADSLRKPLNTAKVPGNVAGVQVNTEPDFLDPLSILDGRVGVADAKKLFKESS
jgi:hypothetical protein